MTTIVLAESSGVEAVGGAERGRVGESGVAREELVGHAERRADGRRASPAPLRRSSHEDTGPGGRQAAGSAGPLPSGRYGTRSDGRPPPDRARGYRRLSRPVRLAPGAGARSATATRPRRARRSSDLGEATWRAALDFLYDQAMHRAMGDPATYAALRGAYFGAGGGPAAAPSSPTPASADPRRVRGPRRRWPDERPAPAPVRLLHAAATPDLDHGRAAGPDGQPGRRRLARRAGRRVRRGGGRALAVRPRRLPGGVVRAAHLGRGDGQLHGHGPGPRRPPRAAARCGPRAAWRAARRRPRLHLGPDPLLDRPLARRARVPAGDARGHPVRRGLPPARARRSPRRSPATGRPGSCPSRSPPSPARPTPARSTRSASWPTWPRPRTSGSTSTRPTAGRRGCRPATPAACRTSSAPTRSRSTRTSGSSRPTTSAGWWSGTASHLGITFRRPQPRVLPRRRGPGERRAGPRRRPAARTSDHGDQLNFYKLSFEGTRRWRALKLWMSWKHLGTEGFGRLVEANDDLAAHLARRCAEADDFEAMPEVPELSVVCFRHLPGGRDARDGPARRRPRRPPGRASRPRSSVRRRLADDDPPARRDLAAGRDRQLPLDRGRRRPAAGDAPRPGREPAGPARGRAGCRRLNGRDCQPKASRIGAATSVASRRIPAAPSRASVVSRISRRRRRGRTRSPRRWPRGAGRPRAG